MSKPTTIPHWADSPTTLRSEPPAGLKNTGFAVLRRLPAQYFNWLTGFICDWITWLATWTFDPAYGIMKTLNAYTCPSGAQIPLSFDVIYVDEGMSLRLPSVHFTANPSTNVCTADFGSYVPVNGDPVHLGSTTTLPSPLDALPAVYYLLNVTHVSGTTYTFKLALTPSGAEVDITTAGTGTHTINVRMWKFVAPASSLYQVSACIKGGVDVTGFRYLWLADSDGSNPMFQVQCSPDSSFTGFPTFLSTSGLVELEEGEEISAWFASTASGDIGMSQSCFTIQRVTL